MDILAPLSTFLMEDPDHDQGDTMAEIAALWERQTLVDALMAGEIPLDSLLDCLSTQGHSPDEYIEAACSNIDAVLEGRAFVENPDEIQIYRH